MGKGMNDTELDKLLEEEMIREAEMIEHSLLCDDQTEDVHVSEEEIERSYARLMKRLKVEGLCQEKKQEQQGAQIVEFPGKHSSAGILGKEQVSTRSISEEESKEKASKDKETKDKISREELLQEAKLLLPQPEKSGKLGKIASIAVICAISILAGSMTSEASRGNFFQTLKYISGTDTRTSVGNTEGVTEGQDEGEALRSISEVLGISVPVLMYRPEGMEFQNFTIYEDVEVATMEYLYKGNILSLYAADRKSKAAEDSISLSRTLSQEPQTVQITVGNITASVWECSLGEGTPDGCFAQWINDDCFYQLSGKIETEEMIKIIENLK